MTAMKEVVVKRPLLPVTATGRQVMALSRTRGGSGWILGNISCQKEWRGTGTGCPGRWWSHRPWRCSRTVALRDAVSGHSGGGLMVGLDDLGHLFQP